MDDKIINKIIRILEKSTIKGLTITELVKVSKSSRHKVLTALAKLEGADKVFIRNAGMAKIYFLREKMKKSKGLKEKPRKNNADSNSMNIKTKLLFLFLFLFFLMFARFVSAENKIPAQLFDIKLELEETTVQFSNKLTAWVRFENFGTEPIPVNMTYIILDINKNKLHTEQDSAVVWTEELIIKKFDNLELPNGKYVLVLHTLYGNNIFDEFRQEFEVGKETPKKSLLYLYIFIGILIGLVIILLLIYFIKKRSRR